MHVYILSAITSAGVFLFKGSSNHAQRFWPDFHGVELAGSFLYCLICYNKPGSLTFLRLGFPMCHMGKTHLPTQFLQLS